MNFNLNQISTFIEFQVLMLKFYFICCEGQGGWGGGYGIWIPMLKKFECTLFLKLHYFIFQHSELSFNLNMTLSWKHIQHDYHRTYQQQLQPPLYTSRAISS